MLLKQTLTASIASLFVATIVAHAQETCPSIPLCCEYVVDSLTPTALSTLDEVGIAPTSGQVVFPVGINCVPIEDPPALYILLCTSPSQQVCCKYNNWGGKIAFGCEPDPPIAVA
ncbi:hypothetical protein F5I97DRAFT_15271 [Phlebopus sp. FC_14]|nr:hypothetical protein F5I97DRAFT_15271 [Phlebopus sp. FC_14]